MSSPIGQAALPTDADLVSAYRGGDQRAATALVLRHAESVGRFLLAAGAGGEVEDLTQETFFRAFRRLESWRGEAPFRAWIITIASNLLKDEFRRHKGKRTLSLDGHNPPDHRNPETELHGIDLEERMRDEIGSLPRLQRVVFLMRALQGLEYQEIAAALGISAGSARVHYHHAIKRLKGLI